MITPLRHGLAPRQRRQSDAPCSFSMLHFLHTSTPQNPPGEGLWFIASAPKRRWSLVVCQSQEVTNSVSGPAGPASPVTLQRCSWPEVKYSRTWDMTCPKFQLYLCCTPWTRQRAIVLIFPLWARHSLVLVRRRPWSSKWKIRRLMPLEASCQTVLFTDFLVVSLQTTS